MLHKLDVCDLCNWTSDWKVGYIWLFLKVLVLCIFSTYINLRTPLRINGQCPGVFVSLPLCDFNIYAKINFYFLRTAQCRGYPTKIIWMRWDVFSNGQWCWSVRIRTKNCSRNWYPNLPYANPEVVSSKCLFVTTTFSAWKSLSNYWKETTNLLYSNFPHSYHISQSKRN